MTTQQASDGRKKGQSEGKEGRNDDKWVLIGQSREIKSTEACKTDLSNEAERTEAGKRRWNSSITGLGKNKTEQDIIRGITLNQIHRWII